MLQERSSTRSAKEVQKPLGRSTSYHVGTMIEMPRAALTADEIAQTADFFSFGTNDLTQMTFGFSRDDVNTFLADYLSRASSRPIRSNRSTPTAWASWCEIAAERGRKTRSG